MFCISHFICYFIFKDDSIQRELLLPNMSKDCLGDMFQCNNSECILAVFLCDGLFDCPDESDEALSICGK